MTTDATPASGTSTAAPAVSTTPAAPAAAPAATPAATPAPAASTPAANTEPTAATPAANTDPAPAASTEPTTPPVDWAALRTTIAKGDEKLEKRLARYSSLESAIDALVAAQNKIASGVVKSPLPENATPEQVAEWRAENGIPTKLEEYEVKLSNGMVIGDDDKPYVDKFLGQALEAGMKPDQVNKVMDWYYADRETQIAELKQADVQANAAAAEALRAEWGSEYKLNFNMIQNMLKTAPDTVADQIMGARGANGIPLGSDPAVLRWLATTARELNPTGTIVPNAGQNSMQTIDSELASISKLMGDHKSEYWKGPTAEKMQSRYRELTTLKEKHK